MRGTHHDGVKQSGGAHVTRVATLANNKSRVFLAQNRLPNSIQTHCLPN
jgi:hypothetical protein